MPDLDLVTADGPLRVFELLHGAKPVLLNLGKPDGFDITRWADPVQLIDAEYVGPVGTSGTRRGHRPQALAREVGAGSLYVPPIAWTKTPGLQLYPAAPPNDLRWS
jgi:hypothetical protein